MKYVADEGYWESTYPWIKSPYELHNNIHVVRLRLSAMLKRLERQGVEAMQMYADQIKDMLGRGVARKLSKDEIANYSGPIFYLPHFGVYKDIRVVCYTVIL